MLEKIAAKLQLTDDQRPAVAAELEAYAERMANEPSTSPEAKKAAKRALRKRIVSLLTPQQRADLKEQRRNGSGGRAAGTHLRQGPSGDSPSQLKSMSDTVPNEDGTTVSPSDRNNTPGGNWLDALLDEVVQPFVTKKIGKQ